MDNMYYLLNVTVAGVKCIEEEIRLDFYKKIHEEILPKYLYSETRLKDGDSMEIVTFVGGG